MKATPSIKDMDIRKLIGKYPIQNSTAVKQENKNLKIETTDIIKKINDELLSGKTKKYCNYIDMGMLNEQYAVKETLKTARILQDVDKQDQ